MANKALETRKAIDAFVDVVESITLTAEERLTRLPRDLDVLATLRGGRAAAVFCRYLATTCTR
jgi:hypothetical protein